MHASNIHTGFDMSAPGQMLLFIDLCLGCIYVLFFDLYLTVSVWYGAKASSLIFADESDPCLTPMEWLFWNGILALIILLIDCAKTRSVNPILPRKPKTMHPWISIEVLTPVTVLFSGALFNPVGYLAMQGTC
jgi:hypothetical protein